MLSPFSNKVRPYVIAKRGVSILGQKGLFNEWGNVDIRFHAKN